MEKLESIDNYKLANYSSSVRAVEWISLFLFFILWVFSFVRGFNPLLNSGPSFFGASLIAWLVADFISGVVHWFADTWGTSQWPIVGPSLIRSFREHHLDPLSITRHDFVETNGMNAMITLPVLATLAFINPLHNTFLFIFILFFTLWILFTNQFHKWSHEKNCPSFAKLLGKWGIILSQKNHSRHHKEDHNNYYFITNGFLNYFIGELFFRLAEKAITRVTGLIPREDDYILLKEKNMKEKAHSPKINPEKTSRK